MSALGEKIRDLLITLDTAAAERVHEDHVPQLELEPDADFPPYIYFTHDGITREETLEVGKRPGIWTYSVECIAYDGDTASLMAEAILPIDGLRNLLELDGAESVVFVDEHNSDYLPRGLRPDVGSMVKSFLLEIHLIGGCA